MVMSKLNAARSNNSSFIRWAFAASGHATAAPPISVMNSRRCFSDHDGPSGAKTHFVSFGTPHTHLQKK
jgi:hypothetical protein